MHLKWFIKVRKFLCKQAQSFEDNELNRNWPRFSSGADNVIVFITDMTGQKPSAFFKMCWKYVGPLLSLVGINFTDRKSADSMKMVERFTRLPVFLCFTDFPGSVHGLLQTSLGQQLLCLPWLGVHTRLGYDTLFGYYGATKSSCTDVYDSRNLQEGQRRQVFALFNQKWPEIPPEMWSVWKLACNCVFQRLSALCRPSEDLVLQRTTIESATDRCTPSVAT